MKIDFKISNAMGYCFQAYRLSHKLLTHVLKQEEEGVSYSRCYFDRSVTVGIVALSENGAG